MRLFALLIATSTLTAAAGDTPTRNTDNHCFAEVETVVFHCATDKGKWVSVCADTQSATPTFVQYRYGKAGSIELAKPDPTAGVTAWRYEESAMVRGMQRTASFDNDGYAYSVFVTEAGPDTMAGVTVGKDGKTLATLTCAEQTFTDNLETLGKALEAASK